VASADGSRGPGRQVLSLVSFPLGAIREGAPGRAHHKGGVGHGGSQVGEVVHDLQPYGTPLTLNRIVRLEGGDAPRAAPESTDLAHITGSAADRTR